MTEAWIAGLGLTPAVWAWSKLTFCALLIGLAGPELAKSGDIIADKTGVSQSWIGLVLLATATSLPELKTHPHGLAD
jgi:cation:H+ antiporter